MHKIFAFIFFFSIAFKAKAQFKIAGELSLNGKNVAEVTIKLTGDKTNKITQSDTLGRYIFKNLAPGNYTIDFSSIQTGKSKISVLLQADTLIKTTLELVSNNLQEVQVNSRKQLIERKVDRIVYNAENSVAAIGTDALELLTKVPGVRVMNDRISLVGKGAVNVMVNDKLIQLSEDELSNYLKSISSDNVAKVEVITNPPARYDAQGNNGLINIVLKRNNTEGFKGSVNMSYFQATYPTFATGGNLSFKKDKLTLFSNFNIRKGSLVPFEQSDVFYPLQTWNVVNKDRNFRTVPSIQIGVDYQITKKTTAGVSYNGGLTDFHSIENIKTTIFNSAGSIDSFLNSDANAKIKSNFNTVGFYLKHNLDSAGKQLMITGDWFKYTDNRNRFFNNTSYAGNGLYIANSLAEYLSESNQNINLYTLKADVDFPYKAFNIAFGAKISFIQNQSGLAFYKKLDNVYQPDLNQLNQFDYNENTQALYLNLNKKTKKFDFQFGLRGEYTQLRGSSANQNNNSRYFQLFPTGFITYKLNENSLFSANYGRRINRPAYRKLNPFRWYSNQFVYAEGNPFLQPSYSNNIELSHTYKDVFTTTLSYNKISDGYNDVNFVDANSNSQVLKPVNFIKGYSYQMSNSIVLNNLKWLQSVNQVDVFYNLSQSNIPQTVRDLSGFGAYFSTSNQFIINKKKTFFTDVNFWYQFPAVDGLNKNKSQYNLDLGFKALLLDKKLQCAINFTDVFKTNKFRYSSLINNILQTYNNYYDNQQLRLSVRYNFGNQKIKQAERKAGNEEERRRSN
ncbi:outer membrane beta-barrel family protein [Pedobacter sp. Leaf132]|uniref:outer membrane beta-barrel family protein n=1 Tax=Pedobacter sp. Leaf132 TaxID=2876557 RepID=UPI001E57DA67|nr:outer membrane beta-barrel family protein [Pedobacter sp. Leaf132]